MEGKKSVRKKNNFIPEKVLIFLNSPFKGYKIEDFILLYFKEIN